MTDEPDGFSQFHRLTIDEIWHFYLGDPVELVLLDPGGTSRHVRLGADLAGDDEVVAVVPAGIVDGRPHDRAVEPVRHDDGSRVHERVLRGRRSRTRLIAGWPGEHDAIVALTRPGSPGQMPSGL